MQLLPNRYELRIKNLKTAKFDFDLYEVCNIYMSACNTNRKKADSLHNFHLGCELQKGVPLHLLTKKRPEEGDVAGVVAQFSLNVHTDLCVQVLDKNTQAVVAEDYSLGGTKSALHDLKVEILLATVKNSSIKRFPGVEERNRGLKLENVANHAHPRNLRVVDFNKFMRGNPIVSGFNPDLPTETISHAELDSLKRQDREITMGITGSAAREK